MTPGDAHDWVAACAAVGPVPFPGAWPYECSEPPGHPGAHVAMTSDGDTADSWPREPD